MTCAAFAFRESSESREARSLGVVESSLGVNWRAAKVTETTDARQHRTAARSLLNQSSMAALSLQYISQNESRVGELLCGKWRLERSLGRGASSVVYAARHHNGKRVAVKVLSAELARHPMARERFLNEGRAANRVGHSGVAEVYDEGETEDGSLFLVMDYLEGETLQTRLEREGTLPYREVLVVAQQVLEALACAHEKGVLHRDLKPENVFVTMEGRVKLLDFGIARLVEARNLTQTGVPVGTPAFMPPEQAQGAWHLVDERSDLWSLAATLFVLASGHAVRPQMTVAQEVEHAATKPVRSLSSVCDAPQVLVQIVDRALQFERADRFDSATSMLHAVQAALRELDASVSDVSQVRTLEALRRVPQRTLSQAPVPSELVTSENVNTRPSAVSLEPDVASEVPVSIVFRSASSRLVRGVVPALVVSLPLLGAIFALAPTSTDSLIGRADSKASLGAVVPNVDPMRALGGVGELQAQTVPDGPVTATSSVTKNTDETQLEDVSQDNALQGSELSSGQPKSGRATTSQTGLAVARTKIGRAPAKSTTSTEVTSKSRRVPPKRAQASNSKRTESTESLADQAATRTDRARVDTTDQELASRDAEDFDPFRYRE